MTRRLLQGSLLILAIALLAACGGKPAPAKTEAPAVDVTSAHATDLPLTHDLVGRLAPTRVAEVRARVAGIVLARTYTEGSDVKADAVLFRIDPKPLQAALDVKTAALTEAEATARNATATARRYHELAKRGVISKQDVDDADAKAATAVAAVAQAKAAVESARLDLSYTTVTAPIAGRAGRALVTEGALVGQGTATELTTIEQIDPIYVNFSQPMQAVQQLRAEQAAGRIASNGDGSMRVTLKMPDGQAYPEPGKLDFSDMAVDPQTGTVSLRAVVPNPDRALLPGMFVDVTLDSGTLKHVFLTPQQAVQRDAQGAFVFIVASGKIERRDVTTRNMDGGNWIVTQGLKDGDLVVVNGIQSVHPGLAVHSQLLVPDAHEGAEPPASAAAH